MYLAISIICSLIIPKAKKTWPHNLPRAWHIVDIQKYLLTKWINVPSTSVSLANLFLVKIRPKITVPFIFFTFLRDENVSVVNWYLRPSSHLNMNKKLLADAQIV